MKNTLFLHEELLLLVLRDREGTVLPGTNYTYALGGAILAELLLTGRIAVEKGRKNKLVALVSEAPLGDPVVDECLGKVASARRRASLQTWVSRFAQVRQLKRRVAEGLCQRDILRVQQASVLMIFSRKVSPEINPAPEQAIVGRLESALFSEEQDVDARTVVLISLAHGTNILPVLFGKKRIKARKARITQLVNGEVTGKAARDAIEAMEAAVMVAVIMPAMMTPVIS